MAGLSIVDSKPLGIAKSEPLPEKPKSWMDSAADFAKGLWSNLEQSGKGIVDTASALGEAGKGNVMPLASMAKGIGASQDELRLKAEKAFKKGDYAEGVRHVLEYAIPIIGPQISAMGDKAQAGNVAEAAGEATGLGLQLAAPGALEHPAVAPALETAATATKGALKGAAAATVEPVNYGHLRIPIPAPIAGAGAGGYAAGQLGIPHPVGAAVGAAIPIVRGAVRGAKAALAEKLAATVRSASEAMPDVAMLEGIAQSQLGKSFSKATPEEQAAVQDIARRINEQAKPEATPPPGPKKVDLGQPVQSKVLSNEELLQQEMAAKKAPTPEPEPAQPAPPQRTGITLVPGGPVRPPLAARPQLTPEILAMPAKQAAEILQMPAKRTMAQTEAAMVQKQTPSVAPGEEAGRTAFWPNGEPKSPRVLLDERIDAARSAKVDTLAQKAHEAGITAEDAALMDTKDRAMLAQAAGWKDMSDETFQGMLGKLRELEGQNGKAAAAAEPDLEDLMRRSVEMTRKKK